MSQKINFNYLKATKTSQQLALVASGSAVDQPDATNQQEYIQSGEKPENTPPISPYYNDVTRSGSFLTWNPILEFERHQKLIYTYISSENREQIADSFKAAKLLDFNYWLEVNRKHTEGFGSAELIALSDFPKIFVTQVVDLYKRYAAQALKTGKKGSNVTVELKPTISEENTQNPCGSVVTEIRNTAVVEFTEYAFMKRFQSLYFWFWYSLLGLNVERVNEFQHWIDQMENACCAVQLDNVSFCVRLLAGQWTDDRDSYLAKLRPHFVKHSQRVQNKVITCDCNEGMV